MQLATTLSVLGIAAERHAGLGTVLSGTLSDKQGSAALSPGWATPSAPEASAGATPRATEASGSSAAPSSVGGGRGAGAAAAGAQLAAAAAAGAAAAAARSGGGGGAGLVSPAGSTASGADIAAAVAALRSPSEGAPHAWGARGRSTTPVRRGSFRDGGGAAEESAVHRL